MFKQDYAVGGTEGTGTLSHLWTRYLSPLSHSVSNTLFNVYTLTFWRVIIIVLVGVAIGVSLDQQISK